MVRVVAVIRRNMICSQSRVVTLGHFSINVGENVVKTNAPRISEEDRVPFFVNISGRGMQNLTEI